MSEFLDVKGAAAALGVGERPILFGGPMVRAILEGRKSQTRRVLRPQPHDGIESEAIVCPYGRPGDRLWVRETFFPQIERETWYRATDERLFNLTKQNSRMPHIYQWKPSIFMPRWASRITLEVVRVRVERLQDITEEDAVAEGVQCVETDDGEDAYWCVEPEAVGPVADMALDVFEMLWDNINAKRGHGWETNPWVWVVEFKRAGLR